MVSFKSHSLIHSHLPMSFQSTLLAVVTKKGFSILTVRSRSKPRYRLNKSSFRHGDFLPIDEDGASEKTASANLLSLRSKKREEEIQYASSKNTCLKAAALKTSTLDQQLF